MYELYTTKTFEKKLKKFIKKYPELENDIEKKLNLLMSNPFDPQMRTHKLKGLLKNQWAIWLTYEHRILFVMKENKIYLTNIGSHDEVY